MLHVMIGCFLSRKSPVCDVKYASEGEASEAG